MTYLSNISFRDCVEDFNETADIYFVIVVFFGVSTSGATQSASTFSAAFVNFLFEFGGSSSTIFLGLGCLDHNSLSH